MKRSLKSLKNVTESSTLFEYPGQRACIFYANVLWTDMGTCTGNSANYDKDGNPITIRISGILDGEPYEVCYDVKSHVVTVVKAK